MLKIYLAQFVWQLLKYCRIVDTRPLIFFLFDVGPNDYSYHQPSHPEQGYDRPYEDSSQHYYEGGNSQYSQQQETYQQGPPQQQGYAQQQYTTQQGYPAQQQGY
eukprot:g31962.t1